MSQSIRLVDYDPKQANLLLPVTTLRQQLGPWHELRVTEVRVNPDPSAGEVYRVGTVERQDESGRSRWVDVYALARPALDRIAAAAGIVWDFRGSGPEFLSDRRVVYRMIGAVRLPDGTWQPVVERKLIDLDVIEEEVRDRQRKRAEERAREYRESGGKRGLSPESIEQWVEQQVRAEMLQWRKSLLQRAETGARLRCIRALLAIKSHYTFEELQRPFVVPRIDFSPDFSDPEVRRIVLQHGLEAASRLFGHTAAPALPFATASGNGNGHAGLQVRPAISAPVDDVDVPEPAEQPEQVEEPAEAPTAQPSATVEAVAPPAETEASPKKAGRTQLTPQATLPVGDGLACDGCGAPITQKVAEYSRRRYGKALCMSCQEAIRGGAA